MRIAEVVYNTSQPEPKEKKDRYSPNFLDSLGEDPARGSSSDTLTSLGEQDGVSEVEQRVLDKVGEALARLGRVKRVGLTVKDKIAFVDAWGKRR